MTADGEDHGSNLTLTLHEFLRAQEINLQTLFNQGMNLYPERVVSVEV